MSSTIFYYNPITEFDRLYEDAVTTRISHPRARACASSCFKEGAFGHAESSGLRGVHRPKLDVHESEDANTVTATLELPGLTSDGVTIEVQQDRLTVSGEWPTQTQESEGSQGGRSYVVRERRSGRFSRTLQLSLGTKPEDIEAKLEKGVLTITFPKTSPDQQPKRIAIQ